MNDTAQQGMPEVPPAAPAPPPLAPPAARLLTGRSYTGLAALVLALLALLLIAAHWYTSRTRVESLRQEVARKLADVDALNKQSATLSEQAREASADAQVKLGVLEARVAESQS